MNDPNEQAGAIPDDEKGSPCARFGPLALAGIAVSIGAFIRARLRSIPFERDEGEYAYAAQLILDGLAPYQHLYTMKLPGTHLAYAGFVSLFGESVEAVHLGLLGVNVLTTGLLFVLATRYFDRWVAGVAAASFALLSATPSVVGLAANTEHFVALFAVAGLLALERARGRDQLRDFVLTGLLFGSAILMKQHAIALTAFAGAAILLSPRSPEREAADGARSDSGTGLRGPTAGSWTAFAAFAAGTSAPYVATCIGLGTAGALPNFWFWTVEYASTYSGQVSVADGLANLGSASAEIVRGAPALWGLALAGAVALCAPSSREPRRGWLLALLAASFVSVSFGFYFRLHYFIMALPAASIAAGVGARKIAHWLSRRSSALRLDCATLSVGLIACALTLYAQGAYWFSMTPEHASRMRYAGNPFVESVEIAEHVRAATRDGDRIAVLGSEPQIYFYSGRRASTGFVYTYPLVEAHALAGDLQRRMIGELEAQPPALLVSVNVGLSWLPEADSPREIHAWLADAVASDYVPIGRLEIFADGSRYVEGAALARPSASRSSIDLFRRREPIDGVPKPPS